MKILYGAVGLAVVILAVILFIAYQGQKESRASEALSEVRVPLNPGTPPPPGTADAYLRVARDHAGTGAAARALLQCAGVLFAEKNYPEAQNIFSRVLKEYPESLWIPEASFGVAASLDQLGRTNDAIAKYEEIRRRFAGQGISDEAKLALARMYESQKPEEAFKLYDEITKANPANYSGLGNEAGMRQEELLKKNPELAKLREPAMNPNAVPSRPILLTNPPRVVTNLNVTNIPIQVRSTPASAAPKSASPVRTPVPVAPKP